MAELNLELSKEEQKLEGFLNYLKELAAPDPPQATLISNKGHLHASILLGALLCHTEHSLKMYCTGLTPAILHGDEEGEENTGTAYWKVFQDFFNTRVGQLDGQIKILVQSKEWENCPPFKIVIASMLKYPQKIEVKVENVESRKVVTKYWGKNESINFSIYDGKAYRLEYEPKPHIAIASFNDEKMSKELTGVFDDMFKVADKY